MRFLGLVALLLTGCKPDVECSEDVPCDFGSICYQGQCQDVGCATSDQCAMEQFCDVRFQCNEIDRILSISSYRNGTSDVSV